MGCAESRCMQTTCACCPFFGGIDLRHLSKLDGEGEVDVCNYRMLPLRFTECCQALANFARMDSMERHTHPKTHTSGLISEASDGTQPRVSLFVCPSICVC